MVLAIQVLSISGAMYDISMPGLQGGGKKGGGREAGKKWTNETTCAIYVLVVVCIVPKM